MIHMRPLILAALAVVWTAAARADDDHDLVRRAVQAGEVKPLAAILEAVARDTPGEVIESELEEEHGRLIYEIKVITADGRVLKRHYDARDGRLLRDRHGGREDRP